VKYLSMPCALVLFFSLGGLSAFSQEIGYVDVSGLSVRQSTRNPRTIGGACGTAPHSRAPRPQVKVTLLSLDNAFYHRGEDVSFEVEVRNTGNSSLVIPWTPHRADVEPDDAREPYKYLVGVVVVYFKDAKQREFALSEALYGSADVPSTLRELRPNQWFTVRGREKIEILPPDWGREQLDESDSVAAKVSAGYREDLGTYFTKGGGSDTQRCVLVGPNEANELSARVAPR
jgi:hypothetical protein